MRARFAATAVIFAASVVFGQVKESVTVSVVEVPVTVVDRGGNPIKGLTRENFEIIDEGKKREISSLDSIDFSSVESMSLASPLNPAARRNFLLVFDLTFSSPNSISRAQQGARGRDRTAGERVVTRLARCAVAPAISRASWS